MTHLPDVDSAWPRLVREVHQLGEEAGANRRAERVEESFVEVLELLVGMFRSEEKALRKSSAPEMPIHQRGHLAILTLLADLRREFRDDGGSPRLARRVRYELLELLTEHHVVMDAMLGRHIGEWVRSNPPEEDLISDDSEG